VKNSWAPTCHCQPACPTQSALGVLPHPAPRTSAALGQRKDASTALCAGASTPARRAKHWRRHNARRLCWRRMRVRATARATTARCARLAPRLPLNGVPRALELALGTVTDASVRTSIHSSCARPSALGCATPISSLICTLISDRTWTVIIPHYPSTRQVCWYDAYRAATIINHARSAYHTSPATTTIRISNQARHTPHLHLHTQTITGRTRRVAFNHLLTAARRYLDTVVLPWNLTPPGITATPLLRT